MDIQRITDDVEVQGTEYKEEPVVEDNTDVEDSEAPQQRRRSSTGRTRAERRSSAEGNKNIIIIAGAVLGVIVILLIAAVYMKTQKGKAADSEMSEDYGDASEFMIDENSPLYGAAMEAQQTGADQNNSSEQESENMISYSDDEIKQLRDAGYTGSEIEKFASQGLRVTVKIAEAKAEQRQFFEENLKDYLDGKSEKYKELETYTWLGQSELIYDSNNKDSWNNKEIVKNCDYVKVPARGYQTFLRIEIQDGKYAFMLVRPERYEELPQSGNIVVYMKYYATGDTTIIYHIEEKAIE